MPAPRKKPFKDGDVVDIQRDTGWNPPWEPATYRSKVSTMRGWHTVKLADGKGRHINPMNGRETDKDDPSMYYTELMIVPTRRLRHRVTWNGGPCRQHVIEEDDE